MNEYIEKLDLYHKEAGAGNAKAMVEIGKECSWENAFHMMVYWYYKAFELGEYHAAGLLIRYYYLQEYYKEALHWIDSALKEDDRNVDALYFKGLLYLYGYEVEKDESKAIEYLTQAAEQNSNSAILTMACIYRDGLGVPVDNDKAAEWVKK
ncbi:tetratricopeptide repeat protein [Anaerovibrio sp. RM50]|uniref:tetratricopeptide repeat protein n=1 Tax=Anaerovibrio sp. RM50 TaxID=1200557 RepID=UPI00047F1492|nr:SEL1-like repeat protein [Anaerovibrio sp. RM50]